MWLSHADGDIAYETIPCSDIPPVPPTRHAEYRPPPALSWSKTFKSKSFWIADAGAALATAGDEYMTLRGESHGCSEANQFGLPYHVSFGRMGSVDWGSFAAVTGVGLMMRKFHVVIAPYAPIGVFGFLHGRGMYRWARTGCE